MSTKKFLTAEWRKLIMANYTVDPAILASYLPANTELDTWNGKCFVSLVGFMFLKTKVLGLRIPFHSSFPEVNLRFYVRYKENGEWKRGVVFVHEIVPKPALSFVANQLFKERYLTMPMKNHWSNGNNEISVRYDWKPGKWNSLEVKASMQSQIIDAGSEAGFITEHYWGYTRISKEKTGEYYVEHPKWEMYPVSEYNIDCGFGSLYGKNFSVLENQKPGSVFLAEGSGVSVYRKRIITTS
ncbi:MAG TPA: DUF2071 domain-containing protein [Chitinophagaceae bacterium]|nr:DUF2071 domain-containing protein [Chitinophagaceae bacterium]